MEQNSNIPDDVLTMSPRDFAKRTGIGLSTVWRAIGKGDLPARRFGRRTLIRVEDARHWVENLSVWSKAAGQKARQKKPDARQVDIVDFINSTAGGTSPGAT